MRAQSGLLAGPIEPSEAREAQLGREPLGGAVAGCRLGAAPAAALGRSFGRRPAAHSFPTPPRTPLLSRCRLPVCQAVREQRRRPA